MQFPLALLTTRFSFDSLLLTLFFFFFDLKKGKAHAWGNNTIQFLPVTPPSEKIYI